MSQRGWRKNEPVVIDREEPSVVPDLIEVHRHEHEYSLRELSQAVGLFSNEFVARFDIADDEPKRTLRLVK
jgi:AraC-like DNA-binding protein